MPLRFTFRHLSLICLLLTSMAGACTTTEVKKTTFKTGKSGIEVNYLFGTIIKHSKKINHVPSQLSQGFEVNYFMKTFGEKPWHRPLNFPEIGVAFTFIHCGENRTFGDAISLMPYAKFYLYRNSIVDLYIRIGGGYALLTRHYDYLTNPTNNIISTPINLAFQFRFGLEWKLSPYAQLNTAFSFNHFSNSAVHLPNYGMNLTMGTVGIKVFPKVKERSYDCTRNKNFKKNEVFWKYSLGIQQTYGLNGPTYPVHVGTICYARYTSPGNKLFAGLSYEYFRSIHDWLTFNEIHYAHGATFQSSIGSVVLGDEIILGRIGMFYSTGIYLWKDVASSIGPLYFKIGANVYFAQFGKRKGIKFFAGNNIKAHTSVAQYSEFSLGGAF